MRATVDQMRTHRLLRHCQPFLNGEPVDSCIIADQEQGYVEKHMRICENFVLNADRTAIVKERLYGNVDVRFGRHFHG